MPPSATMAALKNDLPRKDDQRIVTFQKSGYLIYVGMNAYSNDKLLSEHPHRDCLWMHASACRGSHLVLCVHGLSEPGDEIIQYAARLALKHSRSEASTVSVAYLRDLKKPEDGGIGVWSPQRQTSVEVL